MSLARRRIERLLRTGSPAMVVRAARREAALRLATAKLGRDLRSERPLVAGPFLGELGYELLYWRPYVLQLLRSHDVDPARVTIVGRGGSGTWYGEFAASAVDAFELMAAADVLAGSEARARRTGQRKQLDVDDLDRELLRRAAPDAAVIHPRQMFWSWRFAWEGLRSPEEAIAAGAYEPLPRGEVPAGLAERLPERFVAVKAYFNECVPDDAAARAAYAALVRDLAELVPVVLLQPGFAADDHEDWSDTSTRVLRVDDALRPETNLAVQAAVVSRAAALVSTYGGFCYLGPFSGTATAALGEPGGENPHHERVLRAALPSSRYERFGLDRAGDVLRFVRDAAG